MPITPDDVGTATTVVFATSAFEAHITGANWSGIKRDPIDTTHFGTTSARTFIPGDLYDAGELQLDLAFDPKETPPYGGAVETVTVTFPDGSTWAASGFMTDFGNTVQVEEKMTASATIKFTGPITITAAA